MVTGNEGFGRCGFFIVGTVVASAEAGLGVAEAFMAGPEGSGVRPHNDRTRKEGGVRSIEARTEVSGVLFRTGRTGTRVWWFWVKRSGTGTQEGEGSPLICVGDLLYFCLTARPVRSS